MTSTANTVFPVIYTGLQKWEAPLYAQGVMIETLMVVLFLLPTIINPPPRRIKRLEVQTYI